MDSKPVKLDHVVEQLKLKHSLLSTNVELRKSARLRRPSAKQSIANEMHSKRRKRNDDKKFEILQMEQLTSLSVSSNVVELLNGYNLLNTTSSSDNGSRTLNSSPSLRLITSNLTTPNSQCNHEKTEPNTSSISTLSTETLMTDTPVVFKKSPKLQKHSTPSSVNKYNELKPLFRCHVCQDSFCYEESLKLHMTVHTGRKSCMECGKMFSKLSDLKRHIRIHSGEKPYQCTICKRAFSRRDDVKRHISVHTKRSEIQPEKVLQAFESISEPVQGTTFKCGVCGKEFDKSFRLQRHILNHTEHQHICGVCDKSFTESADLKRHMITHMKIKPYNCHICAKTFAQSGELNSHIRIHTGERPYKCYFCFKAFVKSSDLNRHIRVHTKERPYTCSQCNKGFKDCSSLKTHLRTHSGEKPFKCSHCSKAYADMSNYNKHVKLHVIESNDLTDGLKVDKSEAPFCDHTISCDNLQHISSFENNNDNYDVLSSKLIEVNPDTISSHIQTALKVHYAKEEMNDI